MEKHMAVCPYCGAGCKLNLLVDDGMVIGAEGIDGVTNEGELCLKGLSGFDFINDTKILTPRILHPMIRREKGGELERVTWDEALDFTAQRLTEIKEKYGPDAIMLTGSSRGPGNEANFVMQKFTRACIGTNNIDNCARTCHGPSVIGLMDTVGSGAMSVSIPNLENADLIMLFGYNPSASHPIVARRIVKAKEKGAKIIVVDPRSIETARIADLYIQIKNGCNLAFMNAFANVIVSENMHDKAFIDAHTNGFDAWWETIKNYTPESVAEVCGCDPDDIRKAARMYATAPNSVIGWGYRPHHILPRRDRALHGHRGRHVAFQHRPGGRQAGSPRLRRESHPRPEQRAGLLRHGHVAESSAGLPEGGEPRDAR